MKINKRKLIFKAVLGLFIIFPSCKENETAPNEVLQPSIETVAPSVTASFDFFPTSTTGVVVQREGFAFSYSEEFEQSEWVAYVLTEQDFSNRNFNRPFFIDDPKVKTHSADWRNYKKSGYDKGHLCPAGDRKSSYKAFEETFYTSNISPQRHDFNDGIWNRLEQKTRYWAKKYNGLYVVTGGVLSDNLKTIGQEKVAVPNYFYKILMTKDTKKMIGFLVPHQDSEKPLYEFVVEVDLIEKMTGIDFFPKLPDASENRLEKTSDYKEWSF
ncbi:endonuclease G [Flavobacterium cauense R2A-7]|uniref:Endonuclease G n=1 Tax=Flavobacterium cauense R2A-7 TaxID=1341154 RepID=A0A562LS43_9FLAO|nr:DNA/RNA non-specific endonuclease [Flavobacterium cauense]KGO80114.1 endonuclease [Flavobacterium cauense R2A-7]TWI10422.1 endonuclease G [Flavobacterium cauense R2A-7]